MAGSFGTVGQSVWSLDSLTRVSSRSLLSRSSFLSFSTFSSLLRSCWISSYGDQVRCCEE